jgi:hypothetical protein
MKTVCLVISAFISFSGFAQQCAINPQILKANYTIASAQGNKLDEKPLTLWRNNQQVAHESKVITELWQHLSNKQLRPIRYFNDHHRGIEYQPSEVRGVQSWSAKQQLVDNQLITKMHTVSTQGEGCNEIKNYTLSEQGTEFKLAMYTHSNVVKSFSITDKTGQASTLLSLVDVTSDEGVIAAQFKQWDNFQTTDYADIGDNESDPFLAKMINQGFIEHSATGFYNQQGEAIQGGHHH